MWAWSVEAEQGSCPGSRGGAQAGVGAESPCPPQHSPCERPGAQLHPGSSHQFHPLAVGGTGWVDTGRGVAHTGWGRAWGPAAPTPLLLVRPGLYPLSPGRAPSSGMVRHAFLSPGHEAATREQEAQIDALRPGSWSLPMPALGPTMDGEFPQHEPPPAGSVLYSPPPLQTPLCGSGIQVSTDCPRDAMLRGLSRHWLVFSVFLFSVTDFIL